MATRTFSYTPNIPRSIIIEGTTRVGDIHIGDPTSQNNLDSIKFWNGPEEVEGKIILAMADAEPKHTGAGALNEPSHIGFEEFEDADEFKAWLEKKLGQVFETPEAANIAANQNGMWTNYAYGPNGIPHAGFLEDVYADQPISEYFIEVGHSFNLYMHSNVAWRLELSNSNLFNDGTTSGPPYTDAQDHELDFNAIRNGTTLISLVNDADGTVLDTVTVTIG